MAKLLIFPWFRPFVILHLYLELSFGTHQMNHRMNIGGNFIANHILCLIGSLAGWWPYNLIVMFSACVLPRERERLMNLRQTKETEITVMNLVGKIRFGKRNHRKRIVVDLTSEFLVIRILRRENIHRLPNITLKELIFFHDSFTQSFCNQFSWFQMAFNINNFNLLLILRWTASQAIKCLRWETVKWTVN